jgi:hypothetical protein
LEGICGGIFLGLKLVEDISSDEGGAGANVQEGRDEQGPLVAI